MKPKSNPKKLLIMAGGTGGHIFPAIAVARSMRKLNWEIVWLGTERGLEAKLIPEQGFQLVTIPVSSMRGNGIFRFAINAFKLISALYHTLRAFQRIKPDLVLGMGGYVSGPGGMISWLLRKPLVIHEQNAIPGLTNRVLSKIAKKVLASYPNTFKAHEKILLTGNPVREEILQLSPPKQRFEQRQDSPIHLLVLGGSQGAAVFNEQLPKVIKQLLQTTTLDIWHQAGARHGDATLKAYRQLAIPANVEPFIQDMAAAYAWADLVICRAGATTIAELTHAGVASVLIPYPYAVDDHQTKNALFLQTAGAGIVLPQSQASPERLKQLLQPLVGDRANLLQMALAAKGCVATDATAQVVEQCIGVMNGQ